MRGLEAVGKTDHNTTADTISVDGLGREHEMTTILEVRVDIATRSCNLVSIVQVPKAKVDLLAVAISWNDASVDGLHQAKYLPCC